MDRTPYIDERLAALARHLASRRDAILRAWRSAVDTDPRLTTGASLPRTQLDDHLPDVLATFEQQLYAPPTTPDTASPTESMQDAAAHGLQRWQQGYDLREVMREWGFLQLCLVEELEAYAAAHPEPEPAVMWTARRTLAQLCSDGVSESTARYHELQQIEAAGHVRDLELALEQIRDLERQRGELWRQAAHDLRGNLGVVVNATEGLTLEGVPENLRGNFLRVLKKNVSALHALLDDVVDLARLQAGQEVRQINRFDAAVLLRELCDNMQPLAHERGLFLHADGLSSLPVEGDAIKIRRIAQNLLLNSLKYTHQGGVNVEWGDSRENDQQRWMLRVRDTGPGFHAGPGAPLAGALEEATDEATQVERNAATATETAPDEKAAAAVPRRPPDNRPIKQEGGEGIGLSIVKRLSELLDATIELESTADEGTTMRILFPRRYPSVTSAPSTLG